MKRREFIALFAGSAIAWPLAAGAQQPMPVIGYLGATSRGKDTRILGSLRAGLKETGFFEEQNVTIEYRWADGQYDRLPALAAELVEKRVSVIFTPASTPAALAAKKATSTIPIVFTLGSDPVAAGLVDSLARPGGNSTGVSILVNLLSAKRLELLKLLVPKAGIIEVLMNPKIANAWPDLREAQAAAQSLGLELVVREASSERDIDTAFASYDRSKNGALFLLADGLFRNHPSNSSGSHPKMPSRWAILARIRRSLRPDLLWRQQFGRLAAGRRVYLPYPEGRQARRSAGNPIDQAGIGHQPQNGEGARPGNPGDVACARRRRDRLASADMLPRWLLRAAASVRLRQDGQASRAAQRRHRIASTYPAACRTPDDH